MLLNDGPSGVRDLVVLAGGAFFYHVLDVFINSAQVNCLSGAKSAFLYTLMSCVYLAKNFWLTCFGDHCAIAFHENTIMHSYLVTEIPELVKVGLAALAVLRLSDHDLVCEFSLE